MVGRSLKMSPRCLPLVSPSNTNQGTTEKEFEDAIKIIGHLKKYLLTIFDIQQCVNVRCMTC